MCGQSWCVGMNNYFHYSMNFDKLTHMFTNLPALVYFVRRRRGYIKQNSQCRHLVGETMLLRKKIKKYINRLMILVYPCRYIEDDDIINNAIVG